MSILKVRDRKISFNYKLPEWLYDNIVVAARGENMNEFITAELLKARPDLRKKENEAMNKLLKLGERQSTG